MSPRILLLGIAILAAACLTQPEPAAAQDPVPGGVDPSLAKDPGKAIADLTEVIRRNPKDAKNYVDRGFYLTLSADKAKALADFDEAIGIDPKAFWSYAGRALIWASCPEEKLRDGKKALDSATVGCKLTEWKDPYCLEALAAAHAELGEFDRAIEWQVKALQRFDNSYEIVNVKQRLRLYRQKKPYRHGVQPDDRDVHDPVDL